MNDMAVVGKKTSDYIAGLHGKTKPNTGTKTMSTEKTVTRTIDGKKVVLTPTENFIKQAAYRLLMLETQFEQLGKQVGPQYEKTDEMVEAIELAITEMSEKAITALKSPTAAKAKQANNRFEKILKNC